MRRSTWIAYAPTPELLAESVRVTKRMQRLALPTAARTPVTRMTSPGRLITRNAVTATALRASGNPVAAGRIPHFRGQHVSREVRPPSVVGIMADVSGSMMWSTTGVGEAAWLLARGAAHAGARVASVAFGSGVDPIVFPGEVPQTVLVRSANDSSHNPDRALAALDGALGLSRSGAGAAGVPTSRVVVILSDLMWGDERRPFVARARTLMTQGVRFVVLGVPVDRPPPGGQVSLARVESDIRARLGLHVPIDPQMLTPGTPAHEMLPEFLQRTILRHGAEAFRTHEPAPLTAAEMHSAAAAGLTRLRPMSVIPRSLIGRPTNGGHSDLYARLDPAQVRTQIVEHTLRILEGME
jgi:hypothetical protein